MARRRKEVFRPERPRRSLRRYLIVTEDSKSSCLYFQSFPIDPKFYEVKVVGEGRQTDSLMLEALRLRDIAIKREEAYAEVWVVFDRDDAFHHSHDRYARAFALANGKNDVRPCWSNDCFELWFLLHFDYVTTGYHRDEIVGKLRERLGEKYQKGYCYYEELKPRIIAALKNANKLAQHMASDPRGCPSTNVHKLVQRLRELGAA